MDQPCSFLAPLFFLALAGLAIPVLLHLTQREKKQIVRFPSLMFVRRIPYQSVRRRKIHNWLLLMVRLPALALIILAFARPLICSATTAAPIGAGAREVVVLLDNSYSMGYGDHWERAHGGGAATRVRRAERLGPRLARAVLVGRRDPAALDVGEATRLKAALGDRQARRAARRDTRRRSRWPAASWPNRRCRGARSCSSATSSAAAGAARKGRGCRRAPRSRRCRFRARPISRTSAVTGVSLARSTFSNQERVTVTAVVVNRSRAAGDGQHHRARDRRPAGRQQAAATSSRAAPRR